MTDPILFAFPDRFETERLLLRLPLPGDGAEVNKAIRESIQELREWMIWAQTEPSLDETEINVRRAHTDFVARTDLRFHAYDRETDDFVISTGLHRINWCARKFEIGYWIQTKYSGRGFVTEAVMGLEQFAIKYLDANRLEIRCDKQNKRSAKVAERCGYTLEGVLRKESRDTCSGDLRDTMVFAKVRGVEFM